MSSQIRNLLFQRDSLTGEAIPTLSDFETELSGPDGAAARERALARLDALLAEISLRMGNGISRQSFGSAEKIRVGLATARGFLEAVAVPGSDKGAM